MGKKKLPLRCVTGTKFYSFIVKEGGTIEEFVKLFDAPKEQVIALAQKRVGSNNLGKIIAADKRNSRKKKTTEERKDDSLMKKVESSVNGRDSMSLSKLKENHLLINEQLENCRNMADACRAIIGEAEATIAEAKARIATENEELNKFLSRETALEREQEELRMLINKLEKTILVAPGYTGQLPNDSSRMVSNIQYADGVLVEKGKDLLKEPSFTEALSFGFEDLKQIALALDFAKLVIRYWMADDDKPFEVLADPNTMKVLKLQGYEKP